MNRPATSIGLLLALLGTFLFYGVFVGITPGFEAFLTALILLPIGSGILFYGAAYSGSYRAQPSVAGGGGASSGTVYAALGVAVVAILIAVASLSVAYNAQSNAGSSSAITDLNSSVSALNSAFSQIGVQPSTVAIKVDWCNTDPTGQDRFCPSEFVVNQGDTVQLMFIHNDTDAHTFTLDTSPYFFQINASDTGMRNFLTNESNAGPCSNSGSYSQQSAAVSDIYCVSGTSLLQASGNFKIAQNPTPANPFIPGGPSLVLVPMDNKVHVNIDNASAGVVEIYGTGAFQATQPGIYEFFCHYHVSNGMFGYLVVLPNAYCTSNAAACGIKS